MTEHQATSLAGKETGRSPFDLLLQLDRKCRVLAPSLPVVNEHRQQWIGVAFRLLDTNLLITLDQVAEVSDFPTVFSLPGVKPWVLGLANIRGNLLPIIDLAKFLFGEDYSARGRILVVKTADSQMGLRVDEIHSMRHFWLDQRIDKVLGIRSELEKYVSQSFFDNNQTWSVFDLNQMLATSEFQDAAI